MTSVPKLFSIFHILFRLYCLYLKWFSLSNLIYFSSCNYIFVTRVTSAFVGEIQFIYLFIYLSIHSGGGTNSTAITLPSSVLSLS